MDSKEKFISVTKAIRRLEKPEDFDQWIREIQASTNEEFWPLADPSSLVVPRLPPVPLLVQGLNQNAESYLQLTASQQKVYDNARKIYNDDQKQYRLEQAALTELRLRILESVPPHKRVDLRPTESVKEWIQI